MICEDEPTAEAAGTAENKETKASESATGKDSGVQEDKAGDKKESGKENSTEGDDASTESPQAETKPEEGACKGGSESKVKTIAVETSKTMPTSTSHQTPEVVAVSAEGGANLPSESPASATVERPANTEVSGLGHVYYTIDMGEDFDGTWPGTTQETKSKSDVTRAGDVSTEKAPSDDSSHPPPLPVNGAVPGKRTA